MEFPIALRVEELVIAQVLLLEHGREQPLDLLVERDARVVEHADVVAAALLRVRGERGGEQLLLGIEVVVAQPGRDAGFARDVAHGHRLVAALDEQPHGRVEDVALPLLGVHHRSHHAPRTSFPRSLIRPP